jgi:hypothetical protein
MSESGQSRSSHRPRATSGLAYQKTNLPRPRLHQGHEGLLRRGKPLQARQIALRQLRALRDHQGPRDKKLRTYPTSAVLSDAWYFAKRVTLSLALRSSGDAGRGFGWVGAAAALVAG